MAHARVVVPPTTDAAAFAAAAGAVGAVRVCHISDTHTYHDALDVGEGDVLVHSGDFTLRGSREEVAGFCAWLQKQRYTHKIVVAGNHELTFDTARFEARLQKFAGRPAQAENLRRTADPRIMQDMVRGTGAVYLEDTSVEVMGVTFYGAPWVPPCGDWAFTRSLDDRTQRFAAMPDTGVDVLVTHSPPRGVLDDMPGGRAPRGCPALAARVAAVRPAVHCFGHAHLGHGWSTDNGTLHINAAVCDEDYGATQKAVYFGLALDAHSSR